jgi:hypothetical protein
MKLQKTIVLVLAGTVLTTATALAQQVGTATAVNPETRTTPPGGATVVLNVGAHVMHKERIKTTPTGSVQLLFLDRSTLSIAPNSFCTTSTCSPAGSGKTAEWRASPTRG